MSTTDQNQSAKPTAFDVLRSQRNQLASQLQDLDIQFQLLAAENAELRAENEKLKTPPPTPPATEVPTGDATPPACATGS